MNDCTENEWSTQALILQIKQRPETYWVLVLATKSTSCRSANLSPSGWPKCTALLFCFHGNSDKIQCPSCSGSGIGEKMQQASSTLWPQSPQRLKKYQIVQTKFGKARGNFLFVRLFLSGEKTQAQWKEILFFRWKTLLYVGYRITTTLLHVMFSGLWEIHICNTCSVNKIHTK